MEEVRRTKNVILFIGDGMTTNMITVGEHGFWTRMMY